MEFDVWRENFNHAYRCTTASNPPDNNTNKFYVM